MEWAVEVYVDENCAGDVLDWELVLSERYVSYGAAVEAYDSVEGTPRAYVFAMLAEAPWDGSMEPLAGRCHSPLGGARYHRMAVPVLSCMSDSPDPLSAYDIVDDPVAFHDADEYSIYRRDAFYQLRKKMGDRMGLVAADRYGRYRLERPLDYWWTHMPGEAPPYGSLRPGRRRGFGIKERPEWRAGAAQGKRNECAL